MRTEEADGFDNAAQKAWEKVHAFAQVKGEEVVNSVAQSNFLVVSLFPHFLENLVSLFV